LSTLVNRALARPITASMRTPDFTHLLVTRFNVLFRSPADPSAVTKCLDAEWLDVRLTLFERYCAPSVAAQHDKEFTWLILIHPKTPTAVRTRLRQAAEAEQIEVPLGRVRQAMRRVLAEREGDSPYLITSRLDSDDALHVSYMERVHAGFDHQELECLDLPGGYTYDPRTKDVRSRVTHQNPFISLVERFNGEPQTVFSIAHGNIDQVAPIRALDDAPAWLQVIHGGNIRNKMQGDEFSGDVAELLRTEFAIEEPGLN
jgi:Putative rhamnosyl transferase